MRGEMRRDGGEGRNQRCASQGIVVGLELPAHECVRGCGGSMVTLSADALALKMISCYPPSRDASQEESSISYY